jgi:hypothetical protein
MGYILYPYMKIEESKLLKFYLEKGEGNEGE